MTGTQAGGVPGRRIVVVGTSGSGKTTLAGYIARQFDVPHVELDALHWGPNWEPVSIEVLRERTAQALSCSAWAVDGNYSKTRDIVWGRADAVVWLDYPLSVVLGQLIWRTMRRCVTREELWSGNRESLWKALASRESIVLWALRTYGRRRREYPVLATRPEYAHLEFVRLQSPRAAREWLAACRPLGHRPCASELEEANP